MTGAVILTSLKDLKKYHYDEAWFIVRSQKMSNQDLQKYNMIHVPELSPSTQLFYQYLNWKKGGIWNKETFENKYVPTFIKELKYGTKETKSGIALTRLNFLHNEVIMNGKTIALVCFCTPIGDELLCHRLVVGGLMQGAHVPVKNVLDYSLIKY